MVRYHPLKGFYEIEKTIGCGGFAKVKLATHVLTGEKVAIKIMDKVSLGNDLHRVKIELEALKAFSHDHICKLYQVVETETHFYIVMEYCSGGELFDHIVEKNRLSESESRMFFRQIVSAVAYLHSLGYAHRDLKPENVLLDKYQNLKLIDFGLCARPEGGMENPLFTSCGSPTYAAPELVLGKQYLGQEVDVWAMGVLLYALLAGSLPFDDLNIDTLYKKILSGKYEEPSFMSKESRSLIKSMLQVDAKKRVTINALLSHPWLTLGILDPVDFSAKSTNSYDADCVNAMAKHYQVEHSVMWNNLKLWKYDYHTATYFLLLARKRRGSELKLNSGIYRFTFNSNNTPTTALSKYTLRSRNKAVDTVKSPPTDNNNLSPMVKKLDISPRTPNSKENPFIEPKRPLSTRKAYKRTRSPVPDSEESPVPVKKATTGLATPGTPDRTRDVINSETPGSAKRMLGSIERSFLKVRHVLTPKKNQELLEQQPVLLTRRDLCNVSTTQCKDPEFVISELSKALEKKGIICTRKGFTLKGNLEPNTFHRLGGCSFELEICYLPDLGLSQLGDLNVASPTKTILRKCSRSIPNTSQSVAAQNSKENKIDAVKRPSSGFVGIRRKRLKGDSWCYKKVCEQVLSLTATGLKQIIESSV